MILTIIKIPKNQRKTVYSQHSIIQMANNNKRWLKIQWDCQTSRLENGLFTCKKGKLAKKKECRFCKEKQHIQISVDFKEGIKELYK
jgi:hypothetical protein